MSMEPFTLRKNNIYAVPVTHYCMEMAAQVRLAFDAIQPDCVAVELAETMSLQLLHAASRLPDISVVIAYNKRHDPIYYLCEPCDAAFEGLRSALEARVAAYCIDLDVDFYPDTRDLLPDPYAAQQIGLKAYYEVYLKSVKAGRIPKSTHDRQRETYMARRLKELSLSYDKVLFIGGMAHVDSILQQVDLLQFPPIDHAERESIQLCALTEASCREILAECGWISTKYEEARSDYRTTPSHDTFPPDRHQLIYNLYKESAEKYTQTTGHLFQSYNMRNLMKFVRNYALTCGRLMPDLYQILAAARGCVDPNFAYETWEKATYYPFRRNVDAIPEIDLSIADVWGHSKLLKFHLKQPSRKNSNFFDRQRKNSSKARFLPPGPFSICSYPPEDLIIENFGDFLKKKGTQLLTEEAARTVPFSSSLEDGLDTKETIRHWHEKKLYVKVHGKPPGGVGSVVVVFDEDSPQEGEQFNEKYPWRTTWLGEHTQESDMAFYATHTAANVVGPGISRCEYGGFMMSSPPRRMHNVWNDPDYFECRSKAEILLMAAIDYAVKPLIVYVGTKPPRRALKNFAARFGKKVVYVPMGQLSPVTLNKLRIFHVLDGYDKRSIAGEYIY
jgi:hypothetical protein